MKHPLLFRFVQAVEAWDRSHRIVGKESAQLLVDQSVEALEAFFIAHPKSYNCLLDIGAGSGLVGFPALFINDAIKVVFVEPDLKKAAFVVSFLSTLEANFRLRARVCAQNVEDVSRETVLNFSKVGRIAHLARAFSGPMSLTESIKASKLSDCPVFQFKVDENDQKSKKCYFEHLKDL